MSERKKLSILYLTYQGDMAVSTQSITFLAKGMADKGHCISVGCRRESWLWELLADSNVNLFPMTFKGKLDRENMRQIKEAVEKFDVDVINAQSSKDRYTAIFARLFFKLKVKVVHTRRQMPMSSGGKLQAWFYTRFTDKIIALSNGVKDALGKNGIPENHLEVIYNGTPVEKYDAIDWDQVKRIRDTYNPENLPMIGCVARHKKQDQLLAASDDIIQPVCIHLGGVQEDDFDKEVLSAIPERHTVNFLGPISSKEALEHTAALDIYVLPSTMEGLSQSLLEAMALGKPVIATRAGGNVDLIVDGKNGFLFKDGDIEKIASDITLILDDKSVRNDLIAGGKKTALVDFSLDRTIDNYIAFYEEIINS